MKTLEELKQMQFIPHHDCGCCGAMVVWYPQEPNPYFDPSCDCGSGEGHYGTWEQVFKWYNTVFTIPDLPAGWMQAHHEWNACLY